MGYVFGVEFLELSKGEAAELDAPGENTWSLHGNAILSRFQLRSARLLRLPRYCSWAQGSQPRIGGRMALLAEVDSTGGPITLACVHLENRTTPEGRRRQLGALLATTSGPRVALGGDLNTATIDGGNDTEIFSLPALLDAEPDRLRRPRPYEPLLDDVHDAGFLVEPFNPDGVPTSVPLGIPDPTYWLKLDWLFARGGQPHDTPSVIRAEWEGERISDHDVVLADIRFDATDS
jgi:endonuclease/exonuclease/phosphatase family metal-dependent hydrolase